MTLSGTPEVAVRVSYEGSFDISDNWQVDGAFYCPLVIKVGEGASATTIDGSTYTSAADFEEAVNDAIQEAEKDYAAGTDLSTVGDDSLVVSWEWPFETTISGAVQDEKDTALGNAAAAATAGNEIKVTLSVTTTVTQID